MSSAEAVFEDLAPRLEASFARMSAQKKKAKKRGKVPTPPLHHEIPTTIP